MSLDGQDIELLMNAILEAYPTQARLAQLVRFRFNKNLNTIALGDNLRDIVFRLIETTIAEGWLTSFVSAARSSNPGNVALYNIAQKLQITSLDSSTAHLEKIIRSTNSFLDVNTWKARLGELEARVCRVEIQTTLFKTFGTGFLIGPDLLMTNYHVLEKVVTASEQLGDSSQKDLAKPEDVVFRFDYKNKISKGTIYKLHPIDWLVDKSPYNNSPSSESIDYLDYIIVRLEGAPGSSKIGEGPEPDASVRGWIPLIKTNYPFDPNSPLFILQHPSGEPLKLGIDTDAIISVNNIKSQVKYRTNTLPGSSGSPCFNSNWELVAIHHSGDPTIGNSAFNAGTPVDTIISVLKQKGIDHVLTVLPE